MISLARAPITFSQAQMVSVKKFPRRSNRLATRAAPMASPADTGPDLQASRALIGVDLTDLIHSPYFMHTSDHPGLILISIKIDGSKFDDWEAAMKIALEAKNKIGFVDGSLPRPLESDLNFRIWSRCNSLVKSWILNSVSTQIYRSILRLSDATDVWNDLHSRFHMTNLPRTYNLTQDIQDLRQGSLSLSDYFTKLKTLWSNLENCEEDDDPCTCGKAARLHQKAERAKIVKFLAGLNESYAVIRRQIIMKKTLPLLLKSTTSWIKMTARRALLQLFLLLHSRCQRLQFHSLLRPAFAMFSRVLTKESRSAHSATKLDTLRSAVTRSTAFLRVIHQEAKHLRSFRNRTLLLLQFLCPLSLK